MLYWDTDKLEELFRAEVFRLLLEKDLIGRDTVNNMLSWNHSGFSVDASVRVETIADAVRLGRYMIRLPTRPRAFELGRRTRRGNLPGTTQTLKRPFGRHSAMGCPRVHSPSHRPYPRTRTATHPQLGILFQRFTRKTPAGVGPSKFHQGQPKRPNGARAQRRASPTQAQLGQDDPESLRN